MTIHCCHAVENVPDPTRPPDAFGGAGEEVETAPPPVPVLQSILLSTTRKAATISGQTVMLGGKYGEARLVKLTPSEAVLRSAEGLQVLKLFPDVEKKGRIVPQDDDKSGSNNSRAVLKKKAKR